jgi:predicted HTH domain antitoxin
MSNDQQGPMENLLDGLDEQSGSLSLDELREELSGRGVNMDAFLTKIDRIVSEHDKRERLAWMQVADEKKAALRVAEAPFSSWITRKREEILAAFAALSESRKIAVAFRNKEKLSIEDMAEILDANEELTHRSSKKGGLKE